MGPRDRASQHLSQEQEHLAIALRKQGHLSLDDLMGQLLETAPWLSRSALHRCLQRHGISRQPATQVPRRRGKFEETTLGFVHIDSAEMKISSGKQHMFVAIDMTTAYELEIKAHSPNAEVVYDLFHVVTKYGREVIDRVRVDHANLLRQQPSARKVLKSSRWLLLLNRYKRQPQQAVQLKEQLAANQPLMTVYVLRDELKQSCGSTVHRCLAALV